MSERLLQLTLPEYPDVSTKYGWEAFMRNNWTEFAQNNGITLKEQAISKFRIRKSPFRHIRGKSASITINKYPLTNSWRKWYEEHTKPSTEYSIAEHRRAFKGRKPDWAKSFISRGIKQSLVDKDKNMSRMAFSKDVRSEGKWRAEREKFSGVTVSTKTVMVERIYDKWGKCGKITLIKVEGSNQAQIVHTETRIGRHIWMSENYFTYSKVTSSKLLNTPRIWEDLL